MPNKIVAPENDIFFYQSLTASDMRNMMISTQNIMKQNLIEILLSIDSDLLAKKIDRETVFKKARWILEPSGDKIVDDFVQKQLEGCLNNNIFQEIHACYFYRISVVEIDWQKQNGRVVINGLNSIDRRAFEHDTDNVLKIYDFQNSKFTPIPAKGSIITSSPISVNRRPVSLVEILAPLLILKYYAISKDWPRFNEAFSMPMVIGEYRAKADKEILQAALKSIARSFTAAVPEGTNLKAIQADQSSADTYVKTIDMVNSAISRLLVGQTLTTDTQGVGSLALGEIHSKVREEFLEDSCDLVQDAINNQLINWLCEFNFPGAEKPKFKLISPSSLASQLDKDLELQNLGVKFSKNYFIKTYGLDEKYFDITSVSPLTNSGKKKLINSPIQFI